MSEDVLAALVRTALETLPPPEARQIKLLGNASFSESASSLAPRILVQSPPLECLLNAAAAADIAQQLTAYEVALFVKIEPVELLEQAWQAADKKEKAPNVCALIDHFNRVTGAIASEILSDGDRTARVQRVTAAVDLLQRCLELQNYNAAMEIFSALNHGAVQRLKRTWADLPLQSRAMMLSAEELLSPQHNYAKLAERMLALHPHRAALPYLGIFLRDFALIHEGNPTFLDGQRTVINFEKVRLLGKRLSDLVRYQQLCSSFLPDTSSHSLSKLLHRSMEVNDDELWRRSEALEPRSGSSLSRSSISLPRSLSNLSLALRPSSSRPSPTRSSPPSSHSASPGRRPTDSIVAASPQVATPAPPPADGEALAVLMPSLPESPLGPTRSTSESSSIRHGNC